MSALRYLKQNRFSPVQFAVRSVGKFDRVHRWCRFRYFSRMPRTQALLAQGVLTLIWPVSLVWESLILCRRFGADAARMSERSVVGVWWSSVSTGLRYGIRPLAYYRYRFFAQNCRPNRWLHDHEVGALFVSLNCRPGKRAYDPVGNKGDFSEFCKKNELPHPRTICSNAFDIHLELGHWMMKPCCGSKGDGIVSLCNSGDEWIIGNRRSSADDLGLYLKSFKQGKYLIQKRLRNHEKIDFLPRASLLTVRVVSGRDESGHIELLAGLVFVPKVETHTNNNGYFAGFDLSSGEVGDLHRFRPLSSVEAFYPATKIRVKGKSIPLISDCCEWVVRAHKELKGYVFLAWDIAVTDEGPQFLEVNDGFDVFSVQKAMEKPLSEVEAFTRLCEKAMIGVKDDNE